jgi:uncharacterized protein DUF6298
MGSHARSGAVIARHLCSCFGPKRRLFAQLSCALILSASLYFASVSRANQTMGPLKVYPSNPRYFTDGSGKVIYLTGSHTWANFQDKGSTNPPKAFDFAAYLDLLHRHNHNFIRLWTWEHATTNRNEYFSPLAYARTGPGAALDGGLKFDLDRFNQSYFDRLRSRIIMARDRGIYVSVMLFQGWSTDSKKANLDPWSGHPFNKANNVNGIDGDLNGNGQGEEVHTLNVPAVTRIQEAYVSKVIDTLDDLDNVLYEITNESPIQTKAWQEHFVNYIKGYESRKPKQHPVGMTYFYNGRKGATDALLTGPADWISPGNDGSAYSYDNDPPSADGKKVIISDTDHFFGVGGDQDWVWKSFTRGLNPIYMDPYGNPNFSRADESARRAMGQTLTYAKRMNLAAMLPRPDLSSTAFCLANPRFEYLVYLPSGSHPLESWIRPLPYRIESWVRSRYKSTVAVDLSAASGNLRVEWFSPTSGEIVSRQMISGGSRQSFTAPFEGEAVLYISR